MADTIHSEHPVAGLLEKSARGQSLYERYRAWRTAKIADPAFRRFAQRFFLTRPTANKNANDLYALTSGFIHSQVLHACVEMGILHILRDQQRTTEDLADRLCVIPERLLALLNSAAAIGLVRETKSGLWALDDTGAVVESNGGIRALIQHHQDVYEDLADLPGLLRYPSRETRTAKVWSYVRAEGGPANVSTRNAERYSELMRVTQDMVIDGVLDAYNFSQHRALLDVGGGSGAFVEALHSRFPELGLGLIDLPPVAKEAETRLTRIGLQGKIECHGGSFFDAELASEPDCYSLVRVLYDHDDDAALIILKNVRRAMTNGDTLLIAEPMDGNSPGEQLAGAYFHMYLLAMRSGKCRTAARHIELLRAAGFKNTRKIKTNLPVATGLIVARL
ncbi:MAG: methyltransferase [Pseudomonadota bacterium]